MVRTQRLVADVRSDMHEAGYEHSVIGLEDGWIHVDKIRSDQALKASAQGPAHVVVGRPPASLSNMRRSRWSTRVLPPTIARYWHDTPPDQLDTDGLFEGTSSSVSRPS